MTTFLNSPEPLTTLMRGAWEAIYTGQDLVREADALESSEEANHGPEDDEGITPLARLAWKLRDLGEDVERLGEGLETKVAAIAEEAGIDMDDVLYPLILERTRPHAA